MQKQNEFLASVFAAGVLGEAPVLEPSFTGSEPKELLPDKASRCGAKLRLGDSRAAKGPRSGEVLPAGVCNQLHKTAAMPVVWEVANGMRAQVKGPGVAQTSCKKLL